MYFKPNLVTVLKNFTVLTERYPANEKSKNAFLAVCLTIQPDCDIEEISKLCPFGGLIGPGNSQLDTYLKFSKIIRVHAIFHDAYGFMKLQFGIGSGYVYTFPNAPNHFLLGHISGVLYWTTFQIVNPNLFEQLPF